MMVPSKGADDGRPRRPSGTPGAGGVATFTEADSRVGFVYVNNPHGGTPR